MGLFHGTSHFLMDDLRGPPLPGPSSLALGLASVLSAERRNLCRLSALGLLGAEAAQGGALADPCCGHGKVLQLALRIWPKDRGKVGATGN